MKEGEKMTQGRLKPIRKRKSYQQFIDDLVKDVKEKREIEELFKRVLILDPEKVLMAMEIKEKNNLLLEKKAFLKEKK